jgi:4-amino-4-deoxy-L-arabinose transferase-like glycosyltransferase
VPQLKPPLLVIVARDGSNPAERVRERFAARPDVEVVLDRRVHDRRASNVSHVVQIERRRRERRTFDISRELASTGWAPVQRADAQVVPLRQPSTATFLGILVAGVALRGYWAIHHGAVLEGNGCEYARIAENLVKHGAYVGLSGEPELMFPPLYPILLALGSLIVGSVDGATRLVPFLAGVLLVPAVFAVARLLYGPRVALGAAALTALHPLLIDLSGSAFSEGPYLLLMVMSLYWGLRSLDADTLGPMVWCGVMCGLAYLTRPEAFFYLIVVLAAGLGADLRGPTVVPRVTRRALALLVPFVLLIAPYAAYLSVQTGSLRLEGKGLMNYTIGERQNSGMSKDEASLGIGPDLSEEGPQLSPDHFIATTHRRLSLGEIAHYWVASARRNKNPLVQVLLLSPVFGSGLVVGLITLGLFRRAWTPQRARYEGVLLAVALGHLVLALGLHYVTPRYLLALVPLSLLWVSRGVDEAARWGVATARRGLPLGRQCAPWLDSSIRGVLILAVLLLAALGVRWGSLQDEGPRALLWKDVGTWLGSYRPGPKRVMTVATEIPYYSGGLSFGMPYAEAALALRYVHSKHPDFIALVKEEHYRTPYLKEWLLAGIPDQAATLIYRVGPASLPEVAVYEWHSSGP